MKNPSQDVEPPVYLLVGDADGYLSVLPARTDSKFFAIDVWKSSWKQQVWRPRICLFIVVGARFGRPSSSVHMARRGGRQEENTAQYSKKGYHRKKSREVGFLYEFEKKTRFCSLGVSIPLLSRSGKW